MSNWVYAIAFDQVTAYWVLALSGTILFIIKVLLVMFGGDFGGGDADVDVGGGDAGGHGHEGSTGVFALFSLQSVLAFFMGSGWMGLACLKEWQTGTFTAFLASMGFGLGLMLMNAGLMLAINKLNREITYDVRDGIGHIGKVYLRVPEKGGGTGQVEVTVSGRRKILRAVSEGESIATEALVKVIDVKDGQILVVEPQD